MTTKLKKIEYGKYLIITDGVIVGHVDREVYGWNARRAFPTAEECREAVEDGTRFEFIRKTRQAAVWAFFRNA